MQPMIAAYKEMLNHYADFSGKTNRPGFWYVVLDNIIISLALGILTAIPVIGKLFGVIAALYSLAMLVPGIAIGVRRLHDVGKSGWYLLMSLIPVVGWIFVLVAMCKESVPAQA